MSTKRIIVNGSSQFAGTETDALHRSFYDSKWKKEYVHENDGLVLDGVLPYTYCGVRSS